MTMRRANKAQEIEQMKVEMFNRGQSLERLVNKLEKVGLSDDELELAREHTNWINAHKDVIREFYRPAMVIAE